jgi:hypothetical protein
MRKDRLLKLANFLEHNVKPHWFDLDIIASPGFEEKECGSAACAMGWIPSAFPRSKASVRKASLTTGYEFVYKNSVNCSGAAKFFGITIEHAEYLFWPDCYPEKRQGRMEVVKRIRKYVKLRKENE